MSWWDSQNGGDNAGIGEKDPWEGNNAKKANHHIQQDVINECVWAGKCEDLSKFTIKVWNDPVGTEGQPQHQQTLDQGVWRAGEPRHKNQQTTEARVHDDRVVQGVTDGHKAVIGHHSQEKSVHNSKNHEKIHLGDAACIADGFALCLDVHQHLWDCGGSETDISKGQVAEEEVHGGVELGVWDDSQDDEQVPKDSDHKYR